MPGCTATSPPSRPLSRSPGPRPCVRSPTPSGSESAPTSSTSPVCGSSRSTSTSSACGCRPLPGAACNDLATAADPSISDHRPTTPSRRPPMSVVNRVLAALLALALLLGGLLAAAEIVLAQLDRPHWLVPHEQLSTWLRQRTFTEGLTRALLAGLVVLGLLLLLSALRRGKPRAITLPSATEGVHVTASRRGIERTLREVAGRTSGVESVKVKAARRRVKVKARSSPHARRHPATGRRRRRRQARRARPGRHAAAPGSR